MKKLPTLTIGIPSYNEEKNIANLLHHLIEQKMESFKLEQIIVISDGSTDDTVKVVKQVNDSKIKIIVGKTRLGKSARLNQIFEMTRSDLLITIDADVSPHDQGFLAKMVRKLRAKKSRVLTCVKVIPASDSPSLITRVLAHSQLIKVGMFESIQESSPVYLFIGRAIGYKKVIYDKLRFPTGLMAEDAYACLYCLKNNYDVCYQPAAVIYYAPPSSFSDHLKQSARFYNSEAQLNQYFSKDFVKESFKISKILLIKSFITGFMSSPYLTILYAATLLTSKIFVSLHWIKSSYLWDISTSSKKVAGNL